MTHPCPKNISNAFPFKMHKHNPKYAVVYWFNYRKELKAGFIKSFSSFDVAKEHAYNLAAIDAKDWSNEQGVITEDEITDGNGPGQAPYNSIIGYGGMNKGGYSTTFYSVVRWRIGGMNFKRTSIGGKDIHEYIVVLYECSVWY